MTRLKKTYTFTTFLRCQFFTQIMLIMTLNLALLTDFSHLSKWGLFPYFIFAVGSFLSILVLTIARFKSTAFWNFFVVLCLILIVAFISRGFSPASSLFMLSLTIVMNTFIQRDYILRFLKLQEIVDENIPKKQITFLLVRLSILAIIVSFAIYVLFDVLLSTFIDFDKFFVGGTSDIYSFCFYMSGVLSIHFALVQPLDLKMVSKLDLVDISKFPVAKSSLQDKLISKNKRRYGVQIIASILKPILRIKVIGKENVKINDFPCVFIANHYEYFGPLASVIFLPFHFKPWVNAEMVDKELTYKHIYENSIKEKKLPLFMKKGMTKIMSSFANWATNSFDPISVYKNDIRSVIHTINTSIYALKSGDNLLIFPENPLKTTDGHYSKDSVGQLFTGFAHLGKAFYTSDKKRLSFIPVRVDKKNRLLSIGEKVCYDPTNNPKAEKERIASLLFNALNAEK